MIEKKFEIVSPFKPTGDQPKAIKELVEGINEGKHEQVLWHWNLFPAENQPIINTENATNPLQRSAGQGDNPWGG